METFDIVAFRAKRDAAQAKGMRWAATVFEITSAYAIREANLSGADLREADLREADLSEANLREANLSGAIGVLSAIDYMDKTFETNENGYIVYKTFSGQYEPPTSWVIEPNSIISEVPNPLP